MFKKIKNHSLAESVVRDIEMAILERHLKPGDKLPPLPKLQDTLGASTGTIREALRSLAQKGLVEIRKGSKGGAFVKKMTGEQVSESLGLLIRYKQITLEQLFIFREALEIPAVALAAENAEKEDIERLEALLAEAERHLSAGVSHWGEFYKTDTKIHKIIAQTTHHPLFESVLNTLHDNNLFYQEYLPKEITNIREGYKDLCQIIQAIVKRDSEQAMLAMKTHIEKYKLFMKKM